MEDDLRRGVLAEFADSGFDKRQGIGDNTHVPASVPIALSSLLCSPSHTLRDASVLSVTRRLPANLIGLIESTRPIEPLLT